MMVFSRAGLLASFLWILPMTPAGAIAPGNAVMADNPRVVLRAPGATTAEVFLTLRSLSKIPTRLIAVLTNAAAKVEIHGPPAAGSPGPLAGGLKVSPGAVIKFAPDGFRIVLQGIAPPLKAGDVVVLMLGFDTVPSILVRATVSVGPAK